MRPEFPASAFAFVVIACLIAACRPQATPTAPQPVPTVQAVEGLVAHGEYIVRIAGCNDCHTAGYVPSGGQVPKTQWLTGSSLGYHGPWGTTYATNLRLTIARLTEQEWMAYSASLRTRPIMPDFMLREMREADRRAIWHFIRSLGPAGEAMPAALPPGVTPPLPYFQLVALPPEVAAPATAPAQNGQKPVQ